jgi:hypothetical protein
LAAAFGAAFFFAAFLVAMIFYFPLLLVGLLGCLENPPAVRM